MDNENIQEKAFSPEEFSKKSEEYYNQIKYELESKFKGKYVALDFRSKNYWIGGTATEALTEAKKQFPEKLFYLLQIGSPAPFSIQSIIVRPNPKRIYDFTRSN